ncbi:hypothetical protein Q5Y75_02765 [Ruegeria sp. 2205SS24-7]|uniref:hypothetical protein n=1 Tax=Ruegeria discodermiae TaxID=3064389 RepID=UPI0027418B0B|nr:hypothetical protein [Ruegeria sp. 2205SS24-7]MDP5216129.1 hypothetical protein [Ruegeria sp. 2205SS24-7]
MSDKHQKSSDQLAAIYERAWTDKAFNARLERNPKAAIEEIVGKLPQNMEFKVVRDTTYTKYLSIPAAPAEGEVSDEDLVGANGGSLSWVMASVMLTTAVVAVSVNVPD